MTIDDYVPKGPKSPALWDQEAKLGLALGAARTKLSDADYLRLCNFVWQIAREEFELTAQPDQED